MYKVRYLEQNDKMSQQVRLSMFEQVYPRELLQACAQQSVMTSPKARRVRHFTALSVLWFVLGTHVLCEQQTPGAWYRGHRLMALDGSLFNLPDTEANEQAFGRSSNQYGKGAYPQARAVFLTECGSHATVGLHIGRYDEAELHGAYALLPHLSRGMLLMHDANFFGGAYLEALNAKGVLALFALPSTVAVQRRRNLPDGSYLALLKL